MKVEVLPGWHVPTGLRKKPFFPGETLELDDKEGGRLIKAGVVKEVKVAAGGSQPLNVAETVKLIMEIDDAAELAKFLEGESRKGVLDAITKRTAQLEEQLDLAMISGVQDLQELDTYLKWSDGTEETRPAVLAAIDKRRAELTAPAE